MNGISLTDCFVAGTYIPRYPLGMKTIAAYLEVNEERNAQGSVYASYLTHELRAPTTAIRLGLEILQEQLQGRLEGDERQMLHLAVKNTDRLQELIDDIMDYAKIMAGKMELTVVSCDPRELVMEAMDGLRPWANSKEIRFVMEGGELLPRVYAEPRRIVQVLTNLLSNAIKFTPKGGRVAVSVSQGQGPQAQYLIFQVKDTGCGIPRSDLTAIFDCFNQSVKSGKKGEGTGLGLTLARLMVELHHGRIWAESAMGRGATFKFTLPLCGLRPLVRESLFSGLFQRLNVILAVFI